MVRFQIEDRPGQGLCSPSLQSLLHSTLADLFICVDIDHDHDHDHVMVTRETNEARLSNGRFSEASNLGILPVVQ